jgi:hypothetical protein
MFGYYEGQSILPTFANLRDDAALDAYASMRHRVYDLLKLPVRTFEGATVLQFGPDSGEDALVFARDGARVTLVEPNGKAHETIQTYFHHFGLADRIDALITSDVLSYQPANRFDLVDAEGFIYTVQPTASWLAAFERALLPNGLALITYYERYGAFVEICLKALFHGACRLDSRDGITVAKTLYAAKWDRIPHTRRFESWVMDVMENPFVRASYFLGAAALSDEADRAGLRLFSSWPNYDAPLDIYWHKRSIAADDRRRLRSDHLMRSALSFVTGYKVYLTGEIADAARLMHLVDDLIDVVDACIDHDGDRHLGQTVDLLRSLCASAGRASVLAEGDGRARALALLESLRTAFTALHERDLSRLYATTQTDTAFLDGWGMPNHLAVFARHP